MCIVVVTDRVRDGWATEVRKGRSLDLGKVGSETVGVTAYISITSSICIGLWYLNMPSLVVIYISFLFRKARQRT